MGGEGKVVMWEGGEVAGWVGLDWDTGYGHEAVERVDLYRTHTSATFWYVPFVHCAALTRVCVYFSVRVCVAKGLGGVTGGRRLKADNLRKF